MSEGLLPPPQGQAYPPYQQGSAMAHSQPKYSYKLEVGQQPIRARMCGFGDKDRRPLTPPPCVRLRIYDERGNEVTTMTDVDCNFFVLSVDLWDEAGDKEVNLVMHPNTSSQATFQVPAQPESSVPYHPYPPENTPYGSSYPTYSTHHGAPYHPSYPPPHPSEQYGPPAPAPGHHMYSPTHSEDFPTQAAPGGQFTRNLIGSLTASAFRLRDDKKEMGIWFILQDLSVRTEGKFRLKFSFYNLASQPDSGEQRRGNVSLHRGPSRLLATILSDVFQVSSAKRFQGMIESTDLSKAFARQGIRIPVRGEGQSRNGRSARDGPSPSEEGDADDDD